MEYIHLSGAEDVRSAGSTIRAAAEQMSRAANNFDDVLARHQRWMDDWLSRFEEIVTKHPVSVVVRNDTPGNLTITLNPEDRR